MNYRHAFHAGNFADVVNASMARRIHFNHIDVTAFSDGRAGFTHAAWIDGWPAPLIRADAIERLGNQTCGRSFADPARMG